jgi:hypothetical protein
MTRIIINLRDEEKTALLSLAKMEFRDPRDQAAFIIRKELERQGLVEFANPITVTEPPAQVHAADVSILSENE